MLFIYLLSFLQIAYSGCGEIFQGAKIFDYPYHRQQYVRVRKIEELKELRTMSFNTLNLREFVGKFEIMPSGQYKRISKSRPKPSKHVQAIQDIVLKYKPDIITFQEIEGVTAAYIFNQENLQGRYRVFIEKGNDSRDIQVPVFIKKDLNLDVELIIHKELTHDYNGVEESIFSRDLPIVHLREAGTRRGDIPILGWASSHYKSKRDRPGDKESFYKRSLQYISTVEIMEGYSNYWNEKLPYFLAADLNADFRYDLESYTFKRANYKDAFEIIGMPEEERFTHSYFGRYETNYSQLDAILLNDKAQKLDLVLSAEKIPFIGEDGKPMPVPRSKNERKRQPSDHWPVFVVFDFEKIYQDYRARVSNQLSKND